MTEANEKFDITLTINGRNHAIRVEPRKTLVDAIREDCGQTGTHIGCEHGVCGTCTVIIDGEAMRSCLMFAVQAQGKKIRTVEGLANGNELHPLQQAFITHHGLQCGFCTPGFLMLAANALEQHPDIGDEELLDVLSSNLCRCTGYQNIIKAVKAARDEMRADTMKSRTLRKGTIRSRRHRASGACSAMRCRASRTCRWSPGAAAMPATSTSRISFTCAWCARQGARADRIGRHVGRARALPGVVAVWTNADIADLSPIDFRADKNADGHPRISPAGAGARPSCATSAIRSRRCSPRTPTSPRTPPIW